MESVPAEEEAEVEKGSETQGEGNENPPENQFREGETASSSDSEDDQDQHPPMDKAQEKGKAAEVPDVPLLADTPYQRQMRQRVIINLKPVIERLDAQGKILCSLQSDVNSIFMSQASTSKELSQVKNVGRLLGRPAKARPAAFQLPAMLGRLAAFPAASSSPVPSPAASPRLRSPQTLPRSLPPLPLGVPRSTRSSPFVVLSAHNHSSNGVVPESRLDASASAASQVLRPPLSPLQQIAPYLRAEWRLIVKGWLCSAIAVYCLARLVPMVGQLPSVVCRFGPETVVEEGAKLAALAVVRSGACYLQQAFLWEAALRAAYNIRVDVFAGVLHRDLGFFEGRGGVPTGDVAHRITAEADDVADTVFALLNTSVPNALQLGAMATQMVVVSPVLSFISALVIPLMSLVVAYLGERLRKVSQEAQLSVARLSAHLNEVLQSMLVVKANNAELSEASRFQKLAYDDLVKLLRKRRAKVFIPEIVKVIHIGGTLLLCAASVVASRGFFDSSNMVSFLMSLALLVDPIEGIGKAFNELKQGEPAIERLFNLMNFKPQVIEKPDAIDVDFVTGDIRFCDVTFRYGENTRPVLDRLNLHIKAGETVALIGPSGGGKTTLTKLLLRLYDPQSGHILLDNHDVQNIQLRSLRKHISLVSQDIALFSGTVAENIGYKDLMGEINMQQVVNAAKIANADEFIRKLPDGYETNIAQKGSVLSGGQRQRLAIARALYQESSILILDEATSALDSRSEMLVRQALECLTAKHT
ncbi:hypothetical protein Taro_035821, partial [Colocasia esculenta]|nr:hypothetical protein [Colocasia esculenta]